MACFHYLVLIDLNGELREERQLTYPVPVPADIFAFLEDGVRNITDAMDPDHAKRICGIGIAAPFEMWNWPDPAMDMSAAIAPWEGIDLRAEAQSRTQLPVLLLNDATAACQAEHTYGRGKEFRDCAALALTVRVCSWSIWHRSISWNCAFARSILTRNSFGRTPTAGIA